MMLLETKFKTQIIKLLLILFYLSCWLSISTSFDDLLIFKKNNDLDIKSIINFTRHLSVYLSFFFLVCLIFFFKTDFFSKKNLVFHFFLIYLLAQIPGLFFSDNSIGNISYIVSSLTITLTIIFITHFFTFNEKKLFIYITLIILSVVFFVTFIPHFINFLKGGEYLYGLFRSSEIFLDKVSPRSSGLARTCLIMLLITHIVESFFNLKKNILFTFLKISFLTCIMLFQSRTVIFLTVISYLLIFIFENKISIKNFLKFLVIYFLIPFTFVYFLASINQYQEAAGNIKLRYNQDAGVYSPDGIQPEYYSLEEKITGFLEYSKKKKNLRSLSPDTTSGRLEDWKIILSYLSLENINFGFGAQADRYLINQSASNGLIYALSSSGIFGLTFFILFSIFTSFHLIKVMLLSYRKKLSNYIYSIIIFVILLRSILETSYAVFSIDYIVLITVLGIINELKISLNDIKIKFLK